MRMILMIFPFLITPAFAAIGPPPNTGNPQQADSFGSQVQQNTSQALQTFQNVNYKKLSGQQDQNYFFGDDQNNPDMSNLATQFKLAPEN